MVKPTSRMVVTPFRSRNLRILENTNMKIGDIIKGAEISKKQISKKDLRDKIKSINLPFSRHGRIE